MKFLSKALWLAMLLLCVASLAWAGPQTQIGPYRVEVTTDPGVIPVGKAQLLLKVTDASGKPVEGAQISALTKMPGMNMGEKEESAQPMPNQPGVYSAPAAFPMGGGYAVDVQINGPQGPANGSLSLQTGQNTAGSSGALWWPYIVGFLLLLFVVYRMRATNQQVNWRGVFNRQVLGGLALLAVILAVSIYAVRHFRRPGSMTPLEAQGMEMNMPAPSGTLPVELATVTRGAIASTVRYTGQAVGYIEQDVYPRVPGVMEWMPFYAGDKVKRGQLLAKLDTTQSAPQVAEKQAGVGVAQQGSEVAISEYRAALAEVGQAQAEVGIYRGAVQEAKNDERQAREAASAKRGALAEARSMESKARAEIEAKRGALAEAQNSEKKARAALPESSAEVEAAQGALSEAQSDLAAAQEEKIGATADVESQNAQVTDAAAQMQAAQADLQYWTKEIERMKVLVKEGAVSREEFQREQAQFENAGAKVKQAQAKVTQVQAEVRGAEARVRRAESLIKSAQAKASQAAAKIKGSQARTEQAQADIPIAEARVQQTQAAIESARANLGGAKARIAQASANARGADAEIAAATARVQQAEAELEAHHAHVRQTQAAANAARQKIAQAQAGVRQAQASAGGVTATLGYAEIRAEIDGVVTQRLISPGVLVQPGQAILKVAQIRPIRLQANVAESDLNKIRVGSEVTVQPRDAASGKANKSVKARVTSIAPAVDAAARTGLVEAIVPNTDEQFLPGQYVVMEISTGQSFGALRVPSRAVQWHSSTLSSAAKPYLWIAKPDAGDAFSAHHKDVRVGLGDGKFTEILEGLEENQRVIVTGQKGLQSGDKVSEIHEDKNVEPTDADTVQTASIDVTESGYKPATITLRKGVPARLIFTRKTTATCGTEVVFPAYKIKKNLPLNKPVVIEFTPRQSGTLSFGCQMGQMIRGQVVIRD